MECFGIMYSSLQYGESSLMWSCRYGHEEVVRILLFAGAQADLQNVVSSTSIFP